MTGTKRYERVETGIERAHKLGCAWTTGGTCNKGCPYRAEVYDRVTGKTRKATRPNIGEARRWRTDKTVALRAGTDRVLERTTLKQAFDKWESLCRAGIVKAKGGGDYKPGALTGICNNMNKYILPDLGHSQFSEIRRRHVQDIVDGLVGKGFAPSTIQNVLNGLRALSRWAIRSELISVSPCDGVEMPSGEVARERVATVREALTLVAALPTQHDRVLFATAFFTGLRRGELQALRWENVDLTKGIIKVQRSFDPDARRDKFARNDQVLEWLPTGVGAFVKVKTKKAKRDVPIQAILLPFLTQLDRTEGLVFGPDGARPFRAPRLGQAWVDAGLEPITLHNCRHTYVSLLVAAGVRIDIISDKIGHSSVTVTLDRYRHLLPGTDDEVREQFDAYLSEASA